MKWPTFPLFQIVRFVGGGTPSKANPAFWSGGIPWVSPKDMVARDIWDTQDHITGEAVAQSATQLVPAGSVLIVVRSGILVHSVPLGISRVPLALNQDMKALLPATESLDNEFLAYSLEARTAEILAGCVKRGATVHSIDVNKLRQIQIPFPAFSEQRRIVEILDQANTLRKKRAEADTKAERILPALFIKMFGDPVTNPMKWEMVPLGKLSIEGPQYGANAKAIDWSEGTPRYVRITDIRDDGSLDPVDVRTLDLENWEPYGLEKGDLLFARSGATVGKTYLYRPEDGLCAFAGYLIRFKIDESQIDPWVIFAFTKTPCYENWISSKRRVAAQPNINGQEYASLLIPKPRRELQQIFSAAVQGLVRLHSQRSAGREKLEVMFSSLLHRAFSGDLTAKWREAHMKELLVEMEEQAKYLAASDSNNHRKAVELQESLF